MKSTKNGIWAIKEFIAEGGEMGVSIGETYTFHVGEAAELAEMGFTDAKRCTEIAVDIAMKQWSLGDLNEELNAAGCPCHATIEEARNAMTKLLLDDVAQEASTIERYRFENGTLYELRGNVYWCCYKSFRAKTKEAAIREYEKL